MAKQINIDFGIYLDKSWKITPHVIFLIGLGIVVIGGLLIFTNLEEEIGQIEILLYSPFVKKLTEEEMLFRRLTAPKRWGDETKEPSLEIIESLTAPKEQGRGTKKPSQEIIDSLTAPK